MQSKPGGAMATATPPATTGGERGPEQASPGKSRKGWQLFTSHGLVLLSILNHPGRTVREISLELNLTDRAVALALSDLEQEGYLVRQKIGRRAYYQVDENHPLKYPVSAYGYAQPPSLKVRSLRAENLATHAEDVTGTSRMVEDKEG